MPPCSHCYFVFFLALVTCGSQYLRAVWNLSALSGVLFFASHLRNCCSRLPWAVWSELYEHLT